MKLIIAGSRTVSPTLEDLDREVEKILILLCDLRHGDFAEHGRARYVAEVISGDASGADTVGSLWARARGIPLHHEPIVAADIAQHGKYLGPRMRNRRMAERGDVLLAFWDGVSAGTADMVCRMVARAKPAYVVPYRPRVRQKRKERAVSP